MGSARVLTASIPTLSMDTVGSPYYISPEQTYKSKKTSIDGRADLYSLGVIMYQMLAGKVPFHSDDPLVILDMHRNAPVPSVAKVRSDVPVRLADLISKAMSKSPSGRFQTARMMRQEIESIAEEKGIVLEHIEPPEPKWKQIWNLFFYWPLPRWGPVVENIWASFILATLLSIIGLITWLTLGSWITDPGQVVAFFDSTSTPTITSDALTLTPTLTEPSNPPPAIATRTPTNTPILPTATWTPTNTPIPPTATWTPTNTPRPPTATWTPTKTPRPPTATRTPTKTPRPPTATRTPTKTPRPPTATKTPRPPTATKTPNSLDSGFSYEAPNALQMTDLGMMSVDWACPCEGLYDRVLEFTWDWNGTLKEKEYFELRIWKPDGPHWGAAPATKAKTVRVAIGVLSGHTEVTTNRGDLHDATRLCASVATIITEPYLSLSPESTPVCWNYTYP